MVSDICTAMIRRMLGSTVNSSTAKSDRITANGVTIVGGAQLALLSAGSQRLAVGTTFVLISNTAAGPITGTFVNYPEGRTVALGQNNFRASYAGGDGNDFTLTVIP